MSVHPQQQFQQQFPPQAVPMTYPPPQQQPTVQFIPAAPQMVVAHQNVS